MPPAPAAEPHGSRLWRALTWNRWLRRLGKRAVARLIQIAPRPRVRWQRPDHLDPAAVLARTDELNRAAERYFAEYPDPEFILGKPFSEETEFPRRLFDLGVLFHFLRLAPADVVLELGAGTCWVSHFLNRYGCKTIAVDVSETALRLGRTLFERDPGTRWDAEPEFLLYDGHRLPLPDGACDRIVIHDAFHHVPNPEEILREMARVLTPGGIVAMSEPAPGHGLAPESLREAEATGVLENELVLEEIDAMARRAGFDELALVPLSLGAAREVPLSSLGTPAESAALLDQWRTLGSEPRYITLHKGPWVPTTRRPERLDARIEILAPRAPFACAPGERVSLKVRITNRGDTRWLATAQERRGWTRLGVHLYRDTGEPPGELVDFDWLRVSLGPDLDPGETATVEVTLPALERPGAYRLVFDLVAEQVVWFAQRGSPQVEAQLVVDRPHT